MKKTAFILVIILLFMMINISTVFAYPEDYLPIPNDGYEDYFAIKRYEGQSNEQNCILKTDSNVYINYVYYNGEIVQHNIAVNGPYKWYKEIDGVWNLQSSGTGSTALIAIWNRDVPQGYTLVDTNSCIYMDNTYQEIYYPIQDIIHLYGEGYNTNTGIIENLHYDDIDFEVLIDETELWFKSNKYYQNLYLHVYEAEEFMIEGYEFLNEYDVLQEGQYEGSELKYKRTLNIGEISQSEIFSIDINDIGMNRFNDGYVLLFSTNGTSLYDSWDPSPYYSYGEIWVSDTVVQTIINPSNELITDNDNYMFFFRYGQSGEHEYSSEPFIICPDANNYTSGTFNLYWYNYSGYIQVINTTINQFYEKIDYDLIEEAYNDEISLWASHDNYLNIPWSCTTEERELYGPITDYFPLKNGENIIEVYNSQYADMSNKTLIYKFMIKYNTEEFIDISPNNGISNGTANAFNSLFRAVNETIKLIDRASFGINSSEPGFLMELSSVPACDELLNDDIKDGLNFLKNQKIVLFEKEYIFYDLFTFVMTFIFGFVVIAIFKNQILGIASTIKGNLTLPSKDVTRATYRDKRDWIYTRRG